MPTWLTDEIHILKEGYANTSKYELMDLLSKHTWNAIKVKAHQSLGLRRSREQNAKDRCFWNSYEVEILSRVYPTKFTDDILEALPNRTWSAIETKACQLKLRRKIDRVYGSIPHIELEERDLGYVAGLVDGEGSITLSKLKRGGWSSCTVISNKNVAMLRWIKSKIGVGRVYLSNRERKVYELRLARNSDQIALLETILPCLKVKRKDAELVLQFLKLRRKSRRIPVFDKDGRPRGTRIVRDSGEQKAYRAYVTYRQSKRQA